MAQLRRPREAFRLANDLMTDLVAGTTTYSIFQRQFEREPVPDHVRVAVTRLCLFHAVMCLSKWAELYDKYKDVIPESVRADAKRLRGDVAGRGIVAFRNKVAGHVWDRDLKRALSNAEVEHRLSQITRSNVATFLDWSGNPEPPAGTESAALVIENVRNAIRDKYRFGDGDLHL